jgi:hypothetical protein
LICLCSCMQHSPTSAAYMLSNKCSLY